jgi:hypothetical protein
MSNDEEFCICFECKLYYVINMMWYIQEYHSSICTYCLEQEKQFDPLSVIDEDYLKINKD